MITNPLYIFDMGGVVSSDTNVLPAIAAHLRLPLDELHIWTREFGRDLMEGTLSTAEFWRIFAQRSGIAVTDDLFGIFFNPRIRPDMVNLIGQLKQRHRVICGTNTIDIHYAHHLKCGDYGSFDAVYASHLMGLAKPRIEFYEHILAAEGVSAAEAVFIDDMLKNVDAARQVGMRAIHFTDYERLVSELNMIQRAPKRC